MKNSQIPGTRKKKLELKKLFKFLIWEKGHERALATEKHKKERKESNQRHLPCKK
jgi:hypothetical protein